MRKNERVAQLSREIKHSSVAKHIRDAVYSYLEQEQKVLEHRGASTEDLRYAQGRVSVLREIEKLVS